MAGGMEARLPQGLLCGNTPWTRLKSAHSNPPTGQRPRLRPGTRLGGSGRWSFDSVRHEAGSCSVGARQAGVCGFLANPLFLRMASFARPPTHVTRINPPAFLVRSTAGYIQESLGRVIGETLSRMAACWPELRHSQWHWSSKMQRSLLDALSRKIGGLGEMRSMVAVA
jgi:hypothetical protein